MKFKNYTPHKVRLFQDNGQYVELESEGVARVEEETKDLHKKNGIQFCRTTMGVVTGLPPKPKANTMIIVSSLVLAHSDREDLVSPTDYVKNQKGLIIGCRKLKVNY